MTVPQAPAAAGSRLPRPQAAQNAMEVLEAEARRTIAGRADVARLLVAAGGCGLAVGAGAVATTLRREVAARGVPVAVVEAGCTGMCHAAVQVTLQRPGASDLTWDRVVPAQAAALVALAAGAASQGAAVAPPPAFAWGGQVAEDGPEAGLPGSAQVPFLAGQRRRLLAHAGRVDPTDVDEALARGLYRGLARALALTPEGVIAEVERAGLRGRGGAYFPAATKWAACRRAGGPRYLLVNAEEGEPGVYKDRHLLEADPHRLVAGLAIAAYAIGAARVFVYVNGLAHLARRRLEEALDGARARGLLGARVLGTDFACEVEVRAGAGGYVLGEETVLLESIEGRRPMPRLRPPFAVEHGLWGRPTVCTNAETLAHAATILERGAAWFTEVGTAACPGTKLIAVSGDVARPGLVEVEVGATLGHVLVDLAGGVPGGRALGAVLTGGPSGNLVPPALLDAPLEPRHPEVLLGSGNLAVLDETRDLLALVRDLTRFNAAESCGKCTPCREGVRRMAEILDRLGTARERAGDRDELVALGEIAATASICGLGQMAPNPALSALRHFPQAMSPQILAGAAGGQEVPGVQRIDHPVD